MSLEPGLDAFADDQLMEDANGRTTAAYTYEWTIVDGENETVIPGQTDSHYTIRAPDAGKRLKVKVSFEDDAGFTETATSGPSGVIRPASPYLVSNLDESQSGTTHATEETPSLAQSFTTDGNAAWLQKARLLIGADGAPETRVSIYSDNSGVPGTSQHVLSTPIAIDGSAASAHDFTIDNPLLSANTTYWLVIERVSGTGQIELAYTTADEQTSGIGWTIGPDTHVLQAGQWTAGSKDILMFGLLGRVRNSPPTFGRDSKTLTVDENATSGTVGAIRANDPNAEDAPAYWVTGTDHAAFHEDFELDAATGEITVKPAATIDHETKPSYSINVNVQDGKDADHNPSPVVDDIISVTINVTNQDDPGTVSLSPAIPRATNQATAALADQDGGVTGASWQWSWSATATGTFTEIPGAHTADYTPATGDVDRFLKATVSYTDALGSGRSAEATAGPVRSTAENQPPAFSVAARTFTLVENTTSGALGPITATDPDSGDILTYTVTGTGAAAFNDDFDLDGATGAVTVRPDATIDYEANSTYSVNLNVHDGKDSGHLPSTEIDATVDVTINVTNIDEAESLSLSTIAPRVGVEVSATLTDPDGAVSAVSWQWSTSDTVSGPFTAIAGADTASYTPVTGDVGKFLKTSVSYTGALGSSSNAETVSTATVRTTDSISEPRGRDLPASTDTWGVLFPGETATGYLTYPEDNPGIVPFALLYNGDFYRLQVQGGRTYRLQVKFGAGVHTNRGGTIQIIETRLDGTNRYGSEWDTNRDDGVSIVDFTANGARKYYIRINVDDGTYRNPRYYYGPYTATLTDITGVDRMIDNLNYFQKASQPTTLAVTPAEGAMAGRDLAISFTTGANANGYALDRIQAYIDHRKIEAGASPRISIHRDASGVPGTELHRLDDPAGYGYELAQPTDRIFAQTHSRDLTANTAYWAVFSHHNHSTGSYEVGITDETGDGFRPKAGWSIGDHTFGKDTDSSTWERVHTSGSRAIKLGIWASAK